MYRTEFTDDNLGTQYKLIGKFIVEFERTVTLLRQSCIVCCRPHLPNSFQNNRNRLISNIIFTQSGLTADSLVNIVQHIIGQMCEGNNPILVKKFSAFRSRFTDLVQIRNVIAHASWVSNNTVIVGEHPVSLVFGQKGAPNKKGMMYKEIKSVEELEGHIQVANSAFEEMVELYRFIAVQARRYHNLEVMPIVTNEAELLIEP